MTSEAQPQPAEPPAAGRQPLSAREWIDLLFEAGSFDEQFAGAETPDPLHFSDSQPYPERLEEARRRTGGDEAVVTGTARIGGMRVVAAVSDFRFIGGSMGYVVGERVANAMDRARNAGLPFIAVTCSGGARMQEGMVALVQMAKTADAAQRLHEARIPMIAVLADPTTGGVYASYATQADIILAEAGALVGFAGPRVRAVREPGDTGDVVRAEDLLAAGQVDAVLPRGALRDYLVRIVALLQKSSAPDPDLLPPPVEVRDLLTGWAVVERARDPHRPRALQYLDRIASDFIPLLGDRSGVDDPALVGGLARIGDTNAVVVAQERGDLDLDGARHDGRVSPAGYRKARRLMLLAERLQLPLVTLVDTPGAHDGIEDELAGLAGSISDCLATMASLTTPSVAVVIGEGGSGGALALTMADRILMQQNAMYAITSPEGAASILFRDRDRAPEVAEALGVSARDLLELGVIDAIVPEPAGGAQADPQGAARLLAPALRRALAEAMRGKGQSRRRHREERLGRIGGEQPRGHSRLKTVGDMVGDVVGDFLGDALGVAGSLGHRLRRAREDGHGPAEESAPSPVGQPTHEPEPHAASG